MQIFVRINRVRTNEVRRYVLLQGSNLCRCYTVLRIRTQLQDQKAVQFLTLVSDCGYYPKYMH